jgi:hypothetical protein
VRLLLVTLDSIPSLRPFDGSLLATPHDAIDAAKLEDILLRIEYRVRDAGS